jgi:hypothetical protein
MVARCVYTFICISDSTGETLENIAKAATRAVRRCRGGPPFLADGAHRIASRPHHGRDCRQKPGHGDLHPRQSASCVVTPRDARAVRSLFLPVAALDRGQPTRCRGCWDRRCQGASRAASTRSTPPISRASTRSSSPSRTTTASNWENWEDSRHRARGRLAHLEDPDVASISPIAATRPRTSRSSLNRRRPRRAVHAEAARWSSASPPASSGSIQVRRNRLLSLNQQDETAYVDARGACKRRARLCAAHVRRQWLAGDRRHAPLDRGNRRRGDHPRRNDREAAA